MEYTVKKNYSEIIENVRVIYSLKSYVKLHIMEKPDFVKQQKNLSINLQHI